MTHTVQQQNRNLILTITPHASGYRLAYVGAGYDNYFEEVATFATFEAARDALDEARRVWADWMCAEWRVG